MMNLVKRYLNKRISSVGLFLFFCLWASAQQDPLFTQYMHNPVSINPAYAGSRGTLNVVAMHRQQWIGIEGAPKTLVLSVNSPFLNYDVGLGLSLLYETIGPVTQTGLYVDYAYHLKLSPALKLALGLKGGVNIYDISLLNLRGAEDDDHITLYGFRKLYLPNVGIGSYLYSGRFYLGFSIPKMLQNSLIPGDDRPNQNNRESRAFFLTGGLITPVSEHIKFQPSSIVRIVEGAPVSAEFAAALLFQEQLWVGGMYRLGDSVGGMVRFNLSSQLSLGYSYDLTHSKLQPYSQGTHEIYVSYDFAFKNRKILSPRYF